ncbi:YceD family protein [Methylocaldum sp.]|uniref:YceD family protein n=1 Tax=Methylocaldum sp. TaxID=1969727 RepID=UPI002D24DAEA|nr:YceD family protein [Methylocaldum sp.]HYE37057.1 YceD family protein [Methylocaldum sp.]
MEPEAKTIFVTTLDSNEQLDGQNQEEAILTAFVISRYHCGIMLDHLPDLIDPLEFAEKKRRIAGSMPLSKMDRIRDIVLNGESKVKVELEFKKEGRSTVVSGWVEADLKLECQCCLEPLDWPVHSEVHLGIVSSINEGNLLSEPLEPLLLDETGVIDLADIVQDELLLAIPSIPQHSHCVSPKAETAVDSRENPFAVLAQLKTIR